MVDLFSGAKRRNINRPKFCSINSHKSLKIFVSFFGFLYTQTPCVDVVRYYFFNKPRFKSSNKSSNFQFWSIYFQNFANQNFTRFMQINRAKIFINRAKFYIRFSTTCQYIAQEQIELWPFLLRAHAMVHPGSKT